MRLLSSLPPSLLLLLLSSQVALGAPISDPATAPDATSLIEEDVETATTIETIYEMVTRTVIREVPTAASAIIVDKETLPAAPAADLEAKHEEEDDLSFTVAPLETEGPNFTAPPMEPEPAAIVVVAEPTAAVVASAPEPIITAEAEDTHAVVVAEKIVETAPETTKEEPKVVVVAPKPDIEEPKVVVVAEPAVETAEPEKKIVIVEATTEAAKVAPIVILAPAPEPAIKEEPKVVVAEPAVEEPKIVVAEPTIIEEKPKIVVVSAPEPAIEEPKVVVAEKPIEIAATEAVAPIVIVAPAEEKPTVPCTCPKCKEDTVAATADTVVAPVVVVAPPVDQSAIISGSPTVISDATVADTTAATVVAAAPEGFSITEVSGSMRMCSCDEADGCKKESADAMNGCMAQCDEHLQEYGNQTQSYLECFSQHTDSITEAESCTYGELKDYCSAPGEVKFIERPNWSNLTGFKYASDATSEIKKNYLWKRDEKKYSHIQRFFHCTKHCMHKQMHTCTKAKGCGIKMPARHEFAEIMRSCTKKNPKIATSLLLTCQCLAWRRGVTDLRGSCVVIGNSYYVDRA